MSARLTISICVLLCCVSTYVQAKTYLLSGLKEYPPYSFERDKNVVGIDVDVATEAFRRAGHEVIIVLMPWKRLLNAAKEGSVDGTLGAFITEERREYLDFIDVEPLRWIEMSLFTYKEAGFKDSSLTSLRGRKIGVNRAFAINPEFDSAAETGEFLRYAGNNIEQMLRMVASRRLDGVVHTKDPTLYYIEKLGLGETLYMVTPPVTAKRGGFMSLSKLIPVAKRHPLKAKLEQAMKNMLEDGTLDKIRGSYFGPKKNTR